MAIELENVMTEQRNPHTKHIDQKSTVEMLELINNEDRLVAAAVQREIPQIAAAVDAVTEALKGGGRLIYIGAGTSGRLGVLDASECPPTFGTPDNVVIGLIAGGDVALRRAVEGAEDSRQGAVKQLQAIALSANDVVVGVAASGRTPYVLGGLEYANGLGAVTVAISCSPQSAISEIAQIAITPVVGPEVISGSTRMKAGTAQKLVLNMLTTAAMIKLGKVYGNLMVDVQPTNEKLVERAKGIVAEAAGVSKELAATALAEAGHNPKLAIIMLKKRCSSVQAQCYLEEAQGFIAKALGEE